MADNEKYNQTKRQKFIYDGQLIYEWDQTLDEVNVYFKPPKILIKKYEEIYKRHLKPGQSLPELEIKITTSHLTVGIKGNQPFLDEELERKVEASESIWVIEDEELHIILMKIEKAEIWSRVCKDHDKMDPLIEAEIKKNFLIEKFRREHPEFAPSREIGRASRRERAYDLV